MWAQWVSPGLLRVISWFWPQPLEISPFLSASAIIASWFSRIITQRFDEATTTFVTLETSRKMIRLEYVF